MSKDVQWYLIHVFGIFFVDACSQSALITVFRPTDGVASIIMMTIFLRFFPTSIYRGNRPVQLHLLKGP